jgi:reverse transcriptase-like protein
VFNAPPTASWVMRKLCLVKGTLKEWIFQDTYSIKLVYSEHFKVCAKVRWRFVLWNKMSIPRHRFCVWLVALEKLKTKDKLYSFGVTLDALCPLCVTTTETVRRLFFECLFSRKCLDGLEVWVGVRFKSIATMDFRKLKVRKIQQHILRTIFACAIYNIWKNRNMVSWDHLVPHPYHSVSLIKTQVKCRIRTLRHIDSLSNLSLT